MSSMTRKLARRTDYITNNRSLPGDGSVEEEVEEAEEEEGDERHDQEVGQEDVVPHIDGVPPQLSGTQVRQAGHRHTVKSPFKCIVVKVSVMDRCN
jgi:hypothetical protein